VTADDAGGPAAFDEFFARALVPPLFASAQAVPGLPVHEVSPLQGRLLEVLARAAGARSVLEIGTLGGYSTLWLARAVGASGRVVTLEVSPEYAAVARRNLAECDWVTVLVGPAAETLTTLDGPFDLIFIDADKRSNPLYLREALRLSRPGTLLVADNVVRDGAVLSSPDDPDARGVREFVAALAAEPRVTATAVQTVGVKGWDGFILAVVD
jgi:predicted O-methyltransferase YrrM